MSSLYMADLPRSVSPDETASGSARVLPEWCRSRQIPSCGQPAARLPLQALGSILRDSQHTPVSARAHFSGTCGRFLPWHRTGPPGRPARGPPTLLHLGRRPKVSDALAAGVPHSAAVHILHGWRRFRRFACSAASRRANCASQYRSANASLPRRFQCAGFKWQRSPPVPFTLLVA